MVMMVRKGLVERGWQVIVPNKGGTAALDHLVDKGVLSAVLDLTPNDLVDLVIYPGGFSGVEHFKLAREKGIPQIVAPGGLDMIITCLPAGEIPEQYRLRAQRVHTSWNTLVRTSASELRLLGETMGGMARRSKGVVGAVIPLGGFSGMDCEGSDFHDEEANREFINAFSQNAGSGTKIMEVTAHINSEEFANAVLGVFDEIMG